MKRNLQIPFAFKGIPNMLEVAYKASESNAETGFDMFDLPFDPAICIGYPTIHACIKDMKNTGYRRLCGWIQLVKLEYFSSEKLDKPYNIELFIDTSDPAKIYFAYGYPAELYDAPCYNIGSNVKGTWTAYTYLVDVASELNNNTISFLAGVQWGYTEEMKNGNLHVQMFDIKEIDITQWREHIPQMKADFPKFNYGDF